MAAGEQPFANVASPRQAGAEGRQLMKKITWGILALATGVFVTAFLFRFLYPEFQMEQYIRLLGARQILNGELPDRDFLNRGYTLMYYAATAAMAVFGDGLLGDLVLTAGLISLGAALAWLLSYQASGSIVIAGVATLIAVSSYPALYNYPKIFLPVLGLFLLWRYIDHQSVGRLVAVSAGIAVALLFRHDHGLYLGLATAAMLACVHLPDNYKMLLQRVLIVLISVLAFGSPYILFLAANDRLVPHVRTSLWQGRSLAGARQSPGTTFDIDVSQPLLRWVNDDARIDTRINVRWAEGVSDLERQAKEEVHELREGEDAGDRTWSYVIDDDVSAQHLRPLVADPGVEDTNGIDRENLRVERPDFRMPFEIAPGLLNDGNATLWLYYATATLPPLSLLLLGMKRIGWLSWPSAMPRESLKILTAVAYCLLLNKALIRGSLGNRLADVSTSTAILAAWVMGQVLVHGVAPVAWERLRAVLRPGAVSARSRAAISLLSPALVTLVTIVLVAVTLWSSMTFGQFVPKFKETDILKGPMPASPTLAALSAAPVSSLLTMTTREPRRSRPSPLGSPVGAFSNRLSLTMPSKYSRSTWSSRLPVNDESRTTPAAYLMLRPSAPRLSRIVVWDTDTRS